jgi:hypothetical protein
MPSNHVTHVQVKHSTASYHHYAEQLTTMAAQAGGSIR